MKGFPFLYPLLAILSGCLTNGDPEPPVKLEFRTGSLEPRPGFVEMVSPANGKPVYISKVSILGNLDVAGAKVIQGQGGPQVEIEFTGTGSSKFAEITGNNIDQLLAILVDGKLISAPVIRDKIEGGKAVLSGQFTQEEAERISNGLD